MMLSRKFLLVTSMALAAVVTVACLAQEPQKSTYSFSERSRADGARPIAKVTLLISPMPTYDLPRTQMSFRLRIQNDSGESVGIRDPLPSIMLQAIASNSRSVDIPHTPPGHMYKPPDNDLYGGPIHFKSAVLDGDKDLGDRDFYEIEPGSFVELVFECDPVVGERVLSAVKGLDRPHVDIRIAVLVRNLRDPQDSRNMVSEVMRLQIPKP